MRSLFVKFLSVLAAFGLVGISPLLAQDIRTVDPSAPASAGTAIGSPSSTSDQAPDAGIGPNDIADAPLTVDPSAAPAANGTTYKKDDVIGAAEGVFGKGAKGLAGLLENVLRDQGEPNGYIAGREASGAIVIGLRYGSGTLTHKVEGQRPVYWTGPSLGFDLGGDATKVFVLVYNLYDTQDLYRRYPQVEGRLYYVGGFSGTYLRRGNIAMIPIRLGVGVRLGANIGYMKFSEKSRWLPF